MSSAPRSCHDARGQASQEVGAAQMSFMEEDAWVVMLGSIPASQVCPLEV